MLATTRQLCLRLCLLTFAAFLSITSSPRLLADGLRDTLSYFDAGSASAFYRDPGITAQAARFDIAAPSYLRRVTLWLSGPQGATASVTIFGNEAAFAAPLVGRPLTRAYTVRKQRNGVEKVRLDLPSDLFIERTQFFVVLEKLSPDLRWLSDRLRRSPFCIDGVDRWGYQAIRGRDGTWRAGRHAYAIEAIVDLPEQPAPGYLANVAGDAGFLAEASRNKSIAFADVNNDRRPDALVGGRLYLNRGDDQFEDVSEDAGLPVDDIPGAHLFVDIDSDRDPDIIAIGYRDGGSALWVNEGEGVFTRQDLGELPVLEPTSIAVADVDGDHYLDLIVGQGRDTSEAVLPTYLLKNRRTRDGVRRFEVTPLPRKFVDAPVSSVEWIDRNDDKAPDLAITFFSGSRPAILVNNGSGRFAAETEAPAASVVPISGDPMPASSSRGVAGDWADSEINGSVDLIQPTDLEAASVLEGVAGDRSMVVNDRSTPSMFGALPYEAFAGAGLWADADNDGRLDALITSSCDCRYATLYTQESAGRLSDRSFMFGLFRLPAGSDAVWVDYDGDGLLDLATFVADRFVLLKNTMHSTNNYVAVDLSRAPDPGAMIGGSITVFTEGRATKRTISSGRGLLMQENLRVHFGLGDETTIDSVVYEPLYGAGRIRLQSPAANRTHYLFDGEVVATNDVGSAISVSPNPFRTQLRFDYRLGSSQSVHLEIYGIDGDLLSTPVSAIYAAGDHSFEWRSVDAVGDLLPAGTYVWRARIGTRTFTGRAILTR